LAGADRVLDALAVLLLDARELLAAVREPYAVARLVRQRQRGLDRRIAATDHDDPVVLERLGLAQRVRHSSRILARHAQLPRHAAPADGQDHPCRVVLALAARDREDAIAVPLHAQHGLARVHAQAGALDDVLPDVDQRLLPDLARGEFAVAGDGER